MGLDAGQIPAKYCIYSVENKDTHTQIIFILFLRSRSPLKEKKIFDLSKTNTSNSNTMLSAARTLGSRHAGPAIAATAGTVLALGLSPATAAAEDKPSVDVGAVKKSIADLIEVCMTCVRNQFLHVALVPPLPKNLFSSHVVG